MPEGLGSALYGVGMGIVNNSLGIINGKISRRENYQYGEMAANNADARTRALYNDLYSIPAQMQQLKNAGLSPSLFYGQAGGISGQTGAQGTGATGVQNPTFGIDPLTMAQIKNINADTDLKEKEAEKTSKESELTQASIDNIIQDTKNKWLEGENKVIVNMLAQLELSLQGEYAEKERSKKFEILSKQYETLAEDLRSAKVKAEIDEKTEKTIIDWYANRTLKIKQEVINERLKGKLTQEQINNLVNEQVLARRQNALNDQELYQNFTVQLAQLGLQDKDLDRKEREFLFEQIKEVVNIVHSLSAGGVEPTIKTTTAETTTASYNKKGQLQGYTKQRHTKTTQ